MKKILLILIISILYSCNNQSGKKEKLFNEKPTVIAVNYPLYYFAERIGGELIHLQYIIPSDVDPAYWVPNETEVEVYQKADMILSYRGNYAKWTNNAILPSSRLVNVSSSIEEFLIPLSKGEAHSHGPEGEHEHGGYALTTWLDFNLALKQAESIRDALVRKVPDKKQLLNSNFNQLKVDLEKLHAQMTTVSLNLKNINLLGSHPVYQYLAQGYDLQIESVHFEPNEFPTAKQWLELENLLINPKTNVMLWENTPMDKTQNKFSEMNVELSVFNPCANKPLKGDFISVMSENVKLFSSFQ